MYRYYIYDVNDKLIKTSSNYDSSDRAKLEAEYYLQDNPELALEHTGIYFEVEPVVISL